ncbi:Uncharacterized protein APZ42_022847 [Daphnia magna]|uniref:Uncharacterized protein n=1 Tax=Daphnia magna TaxID=35525 RepID=A0A164VUQ0_9CRUS|nr:Uncharacterized protein APZ42_022847 [Daphnia magna]
MVANSSREDMAGRKAINDKLTYRRLFFQRAHVKLTLCSYSKTIIPMLPENVKDYKLKVPDLQLTTPCNLW